MPRHDPIRRLLRRLLPLATALLAGLAAPHAFAQPVWHAERDGIELTLVGTFHVLHPGYAGLPAPLPERLGRADAVLLELGPEEEARLAADPTIFLARDGESAADKLSADTLRRVHALLVPFGMPAEAVSAMSPMMLVGMLGILPFAEAGFTIGDSVEKRLSDAVAPRGATVAGLESVEIQLAAIERFTPAEFDALISATLDDLASGQARDDVAQMWDAYQRADLDHIARITERSVQRTTELQSAFRKLATERNTPILDRLEAWLAEHRPAHAVVGIGALHWTGEDNLIDGLRARGFRVEPLRLQTTPPR
ncbi:TraB/GumN family protein [Pseudothauera nasutitermitis]|nr:TraB/GumN family protein [Pseudothauera nasutitermitis]